MNRLIAAIFFVGMAAGTAGAMPLAPVEHALNSNVVEIAGGCGPGFHRGPFGGCRGQVWRRHDGRRWIYKKFIEYASDHDG